MNSLQLAIGLPAFFLLVYLYWLDYRTRKDRLKELEWLDSCDWKNYLLKHPELCQFIPECRTYTTTKCHKNIHRFCSIYLELIGETDHDDT